MMEVFKVTLRRCRRANWALPNSLCSGATTIESHLYLSPTICHTEEISKPHFCFLFLVWSTATLSLFMKFTSLIRLSHHTLKAFEKKSILEATPVVVQQDAKVSCVILATQVFAMSLHSVWKPTAAMRTDNAQICLIYLLALKLSLTGGNAHR